MPLELWTQAAMQGFRIIEIPVPLLYLDLNRSFGGSLDEAEVRLAYYNKVLDESVCCNARKGLRTAECRCGQATACCCES